MYISLRSLFPWLTSETLRSGILTPAFCLIRLVHQSLDSETPTEQRKSRRLSKSCCNFVVLSLPAAEEYRACPYLYGWIVYSFRVLTVGRPSLTYIQQNLLHACESIGSIKLAYYGSLYLVFSGKGNILVALATSDMPRSLAPIALDRLLYTQLQQFVASPKKSLDNWFLCCTALLAALSHCHVQLFKRKC
jgi:hypothetical protein